ncbi:MAG: 3-deoxy-D-manno-octulosonic acid kinase [Pseudomonadota bacterium]
MLVTNSAYPGVSESWFNPDWWETGIEPVSAGGRGSAWFLNTKQGEMVLRHYRRGGLVAKFVARSYLFTGWSNTRSFQEFQLLRNLHGQGLPVPEPVAAWAWKGHLASYRAAILVRRISGAVPFPEVDNPEDVQLWERVGHTVRQFHDAGLDHADLNCDNILIVNQEVYLIDFDRCRLRGSGRGGDWKESNLKRLRRSVSKRMAIGSPEKCWSVLMAAYHSADSGAGVSPG